MFALNNSASLSKLTPQVAGRRDVPVVYFPKCPWERQIPGMASDADSFVLFFFLCYQLISGS